MADNKSKRLGADDVLPVDLSGGEEWIGGGTTYSPGPHRVEILGFDEGVGRESNTPLYKLACEIISGPGDEDTDVGKEIGRNFSVGSPEGVNFLRGLFKLLLGEDWRKGLDKDNQIHLGAVVGAKFDIMFNERSYEDKKSGETRKTCEMDFRTVDNVELPAAKAKAATATRRPSR